MEAHPWKEITCTIAEAKAKFNLVTTYIPSGVSLDRDQVNLGCNLATFGAVSRAARTARIVADAIAIIRRETGHVAPCVKPTVAPAANGTSPPPMGAAIWYPREAPL
jgi:hypothetical protein